MDNPLCGANTVAPQALVAWGTLRGPISVVTIDEYAKEAVANTRMDYQFLCDGDKGLNSAIKEPSNATGVGKVSVSQAGRHGSGLRSPPLLTSRVGPRWDTCTTATLMQTTAPGSLFPRARPGLDRFPSKQPQLSNPAAPRMPRKRSHSASVVLSFLPPMPLLIPTHTHTRT